MKRLYILLMVLLLVLCAAGCSKPVSNPDSSIDSALGGENSPTETTVIQIPEFDVNTALFVCQDRCDIEGDRDSLYFYNYKGDVLEESQSVQVGFYAKNGLAPALDPISGKIGFVDRDGIFVIEPQWDDAAAFSDDGLALVISEVESETQFVPEEKYGFINEKGEQVVPCIYDDATSFYSCGLAIVGVEVETGGTHTDSEGNVQTYTSTSRQWGVVDKTGKVIIDPQYRRIEHITEQYIFCTSNDAYEIYDLSGNVLQECDVYIDETHSYFYTMKDGEIYRYIREQKLTGPVTSENISDYYKFTEERVFDGKEFVNPPYEYDLPYIRYERVATTSTGKGYGVLKPGENRGDEGTVLIPYMYDQLIQYGSFYVGIRYQNGDSTEQLLDIYNKNFEKTAENLQYTYYPHRTDSFGENIVLPDGYFQVSRYDAKSQETVCGIIDSTGKVIVPLLYYRPIRLLTYEGAGGKFYLPAWL